MCCDVQKWIGHNGARDVAFSLIPTFLYQTNLANNGGVIYAKENVRTKTHGLNYRVIGSNTQMHSPQYIAPTYSAILFLAKQRWFEKRKNIMFTRICGSLTTGLFTALNITPLTMPFDILTADKHK